MRRIVPLTVLILAIPVAAARAQPRSAAAGCGQECGEKQPPSPLHLIIDWTAQIGVSHGPQDLGALRWAWRLGVLYDIDETYGVGVAGLLAITPLHERDPDMAYGLVGRLQRRMSKSWTGQLELGALFHDPFREAEGEIGIAGMVGAALKHRDGGGFGVELDVGRTSPFGVPPQPKSTQVALFFGVELHRKWTWLGVAVLAGFLAITVRPCGHNTPTLCS